MPPSVTRLRRWFATAAILMVAIVAGMYFYARWRVRGAVRELPAKIGLDIQQTAEGFAISKSEEGRTLFTVSANKAVQFKEGGRAQLKNVRIIVYGKDSSRFDRIAGDSFEYDPKSGDVVAQGKVLIDLEANPEGAKSIDQAPPAQARKPIHVETDGLVFNKNTGDASSSGKVVFATPDATGSAVGVNYVSKTGAMTLRSAVDVNVVRPRAFRLLAENGVITKNPSEVVLHNTHLARDNQTLRSDRATFFLRSDDTVEGILAEGNVEGEVQGNTPVSARSNRADLTLTGPRNLLTTVVLSGDVHLATQGAQPAQGDAGQVTLHFGPNQILQKVHAEQGVHLIQDRASPAQAGAEPSGPSPSPPRKAPPQDTASEGGAALPGQRGDQRVEMIAPIMDFLVKNGRQLQLAETSGPPQILIMQPSTRQKTIVTADRFIASFTAKNRIDTLHGEPNAKIVSTSPGQPDRVSTSPTLDVSFQQQGGIQTIVQSGGLAYVSGTQRAWAQRGVYTAGNDTLVLTGAPRVVDGGLTTTAQTIHFDRTTNDAIAEGNVKSTYSDLKPQPDGAMLASSDPIHVVSRSMTAHRSSAVAVYTGNARLWQNSNVVEAPTLQFDRDHRSLVAEASPSQEVKTVLVQVDKTGKTTPVTILSSRLTYNDAERKIVLTGGVTAEGADSKMTANRMTVFLAARKQSQAATPSLALAPQAGQVEKIVAEEKVVVVQPARRATGEHLVYVAADDRFDLTGGPPSIFDAERGKITGDSLTFFRRDDRVLVEGRQTSPAVTRTQVAR